MKCLRRKYSVSYSSIKRYLILERKESDWARIVHCLKYNKIMITINMIMIINRMCGIAMLQTGINISLHKDLSPKFIQINLLTFWKRREDSLQWKIYFWRPINNWWWYVKRIKSNYNLEAIKKIEWQQELIKNTKSHFRRR